MWYIKKFKNNDEYAEYLNSEDVWVPRVSYILNDHIEVFQPTDTFDPYNGNDASMGEDDWSTLEDTIHHLPKGGDHKRWVDYTKFGVHFIEIVNGIMYFNDKTDEEGQEYKAYIVDGSLNLELPPGKSSFDPATGTITIINYPEDTYSNKPIVVI